MKVIRFFVAVSLLAAPAAAQEYRGGYQPQPGGLPLEKALAQPAPMGAVLPQDKGVPAEKPFAQEQVTSGVFTFAEPLADHQSKAFLTPAGDAGITMTPYLVTGQKVSDLKEVAVHLRGRNDNGNVFIDVKVTRDGDKWTASIENQAGKFENSGVKVNVAAREGGLPKFEITIPADTLKGMKADRFNYFYASTNPVKDTDRVPFLFKLQFTKP